MFARPPDICCYTVNKVVKQDDFKMTKIWVKFVPKSLTSRTKGITLNMDLKFKSKPEKSSKVLHSFNTRIFFFFFDCSNGSKTDSDRPSLSLKTNLKIFGRTLFTLQQRSSGHQLI